MKIPKHPQDDCVQLSCPPPRKSTVTFSDVKYEPKRPDVSGDFFILLGDIFLSTSPFTEGKSTEWKTKLLRKINSCANAFSGHSNGFWNKPQQNIIHSFIFTVLKVNKTKTFLIFHLFFNFFTYGVFFIVHEHTVCPLVFPIL